METRREQLKIDPEKCTACHRCTLACAMKHHGSIDPRLSRIKILEFREQGLNMPVVCMACADAPCMNVCPMNARKRTANGSVVTDDAVCIGCRACVYICPVASPAENPHTGRTMTCDMCEDDESGPWCVKSCGSQGALTVWQNDTLVMETARRQALCFKRMCF
jgi:Fe-S-cluster-containing hydrogenase component 2